jgi:hypothetical protein
MSDASIFLVVGLALMAVGASSVLIAAWVLVTGQRPVWLRRRQSLTDAFVRWWAVGLLLTGFSVIAIGGPYALGYPVTGTRWLVQVVGYLLMLGAIGCWIYIVRRSGYRAP